MAKHRPCSRMVEHRLPTAAVAITAMVIAYSEMKLANHAIITRPLIHVNVNASNLTASVLTILAKTKSHATKAMNFVQVVNQEYQAFMSVKLTIKSKELNCRQTWSPLSLYILLLSFQKVSTPCLAPKLRGKTRSLCETCGTKKVLCLHGRFVRKP